MSRSLSGTSKLWPSAARMELSLWTLAEVTRKISRITEQVNTMQWWLQEQQLGTQHPPPKSTVHNCPTCPTTPTTSSKTRLNRTSLYIRKRGGAALNLFRSKLRRTSTKMMASTRRIKAVERGTRQPLRDQIQCRYRTTWRWTSKKERSKTIL